MRALMLLAALTACTDAAEDPADLHRVTDCGDSWELELFGMKSRPPSCEVPCEEAREHDSTCAIVPDDTGGDTTLMNVFTFAGVRGGCDSHQSGAVYFHECGK